MLSRLPVSVRSQTTTQTVVSTLSKIRMISSNSDGQFCFRSVQLKRENNDKYLDLE
jgi:hypothetical protein